MIVTMKKKNKEGKFFLPFILLVFLYLLSIKSVDATSFVDIIWDINTILYGIVAGIAILLITLHGIRWKIAESPEAREEAKRGILNVIFGLVIVIIATALVHLIL
jgi:hypothetical protein